VNSYGPALALNASKGSPATPAAVSSGGDLGFLTFNGYDGANFIPGAHIAAFVDGTPGANDMPGRLVFSTTADGASSPTERMRITSDAYVRLAAGTGGIQFNGDTAVANALDDYEEGTWSPQLQFGGATTGIIQSVSSGHYTKVGRLVVARCTVELSSKGAATGAATVAGLPFTSSFESYGSFRIYNAITWTSGAQFTFQISGAVVSIYTTVSGAFVADLTDTNFANNSAFNFTISYFV
jgi:hypothetical protein